MHILVIDNIVYTIFIHSNNNSTALQQDYGEDETIENNLKLKVKSDFSKCGVNAQQRNSNPTHITTILCHKTIDNT